MAKLDKAAILKMIRREGEKQLERWVESDGVPMVQDRMENLHIDTGRLVASIHQEDGNHIVIGGQSEAPTARDDGRGERLVDYAIYVEARFSPVRGEIIPMLEQATGGSAG
jgi:hypothetical protein